MWLREHFSDSIYKASEEIDVPESTIRQHEQRNKHGNLAYLAIARKKAGVSWEALGKRIDAAVFESNNEGGKK